MDEGVWKGKERMWLDDCAVVKHLTAEREDVDKHSTCGERNGE